MRRALPFGFLAAYTSRKQALATMRQLVQTAIASKFDGFDDRLKLRKTDYAKVLDHFTDAARRHYNESLHLYAAIASQPPHEATQRQRQADQRFVQHSRDPLKPCGILLEDK